jgi:hypothetical protein
MNTAQYILAKLYQDNRDYVIYYVEFQYLITDLNWNDAVKYVALHDSLSEELKDILSIQDLPKE